MTSVTLKSGQVATLSGLESKPQFIEQVAEAIFEEWRGYWIHELGVSSPAEVAAWLRTVQGPDSLPYYAVAHIGDELLGCAGCDQSEREGDTRGPLLMDVFVLPKHRGCGAFKPLVYHIMNAQRNRGLKEMYLWTYPEMLPVYERLGWRFLGNELWFTEGQGLVPQPTLIADLTLDLPPF